MGKQYCTFYVNEYYLGVEITHVQEVLKKQQLFYVPLADSDIKGLINLRGEIITAIDMWEKLYVDKKSDKEVNVVVKTKTGFSSLTAEKIGDIISVNEHKSKSIPSHLDDRLKCFITSVHQVDDELLLLINLDKM